MFRKRQCRTGFVLLAWALTCLGVVMWPFLGTVTQAGVGDSQRARKMMESIHQVFHKYSNSVGVLSLEEQDRIDALEKAIAGDLKDNPDKIDQPAAVRDDALARFRSALTPAHQKRFDKLRADDDRQQDSLTTSDHLKQIGLAMIMYARDHNDTLPPDFATLISKSLGPAVFLAGGATTQPSTAPADQVEPSGAKWVNQNTDFIFLAAGKSFSQLPASFVVVYVKPAAAKYGNAFLLDDGSVESLSAEQSGAVVADLQAGRNPPPSLTKK